MKVLFNNLHGFYIGRINNNYLQFFFVEYYKQSHVISRRTNKWKAVALQRNCTFQYSSTNFCCLSAYLSNLVSNVPFLKIANVYIIVITRKYSAWNLIKAAIILGCNIRKYSLQKLVLYFQLVPPLMKNV